MHWQELMCTVPVLPGQAFGQASETEMGRAKRERERTATTREKKNRGLRLCKEHFGKVLDEQTLIKAAK